jgi:hypothetical protein
MMHVNAKRKHEEQTCVIQGLKAWYKGEAECLPRVYSWVKSAYHLCMIESYKMRDHMEGIMRPVYEKEGLFYMPLVTHDSYIPRQVQLVSMLDVFVRRDGDDDDADVILVQDEVLNRAIDILNEDTMRYDSEALQAVTDIYTRHGNNDESEPALTPSQVLRHLVEKCERNFSMLQVTPEYMTTLIAHMKWSNLKRPRVTGHAPSTFGLMLHHVTRRYLKAVMTNKSFQDLHHISCSLAAVTLALGEKHCFSRGEMDLIKSVLRC